MITLLRPCDDSVELCSDDSVKLCWDTSSVEEEDSNMDRPVEVEILVEDEIKSDVVGQYGSKSYFLQLILLKWYHYPTDRIYGLVRDKLNLPLISAFSKSESVLNRHNMAIENRFRF